MKTLLAFLAARTIPFQKIEHEAVFTVEESSKLPPMPGASTKNLFLRDEKSGAFYLVSVADDKRVDIKALGKLLNAGKLSFGKADDMKRLLGVEPGSVTLFGALHDVDKAVTVVIDESVWNAELMQCHPLTNTATIIIAPADMKRFFDALHHTFQVVNVPARE